ncbi:MAG: histidine kinase [Candidatus Marinimicrobia bacterium]|nr:histidine kinase [Candidatus Neomarinimicrobiota bacterium]
MFRFILFSLLIVSAYSNPQVTFIVKAPDGTDQVTVTGNLDELGNWNPASVPMEKIGDNEFFFELEIPKGTILEYKFTRGSWMTEALLEDKSIPLNHQLYVFCDTTIIYTIPFWKDELIMLGSGITGTVRYHKNVYSPQLKNERNIVVWLPPSYSSNPDHRYPVLYLLDGQNCFDPKTSFAGQDWQLDETATDLTTRGLMKEIIMVGIYNSEDRKAEYSPVHRGNQYCDFLINTVKPFIDSTYRTLTDNKHTATMGSSMGGIISFHLAWEYPDVFSMSGCLSPAFFVDDNEIVLRVKGYSGSDKGIKLAIFNGTEGLDADLQPAIDEMIAELSKKGFLGNKNLLYKVFKGAEHNESAWAEQVPEVLPFFFGK